MCACARAHMRHGITGAHHHEQFGHRVQMSGCVFILCATRTQVVFIHICTKGVFVCAVNTHAHVRRDTCTRAYFVVLLPITGTRTWGGRTTDHGLWEQRAPQNGKAAGEVGYVRVSPCGYLCLFVCACVCAWCGQGVMCERVCASVFARVCAPLQTLSAVITYAHAHTNTDTRQRNTLTH